MSSTTKKTSGKGVRYSDAQKKEITDFVTHYNTTNGRGGQSLAASKYGVSQLTISTWLKAAGGSSNKSAKAPKAAKVAKAPKAPKAAKKAKSGRGGSRYSAEQKQEVVDFTVAYNEANGRGGQSKAAAKFNVSPLTVMAWLKAAGIKKGGKKVVAKAAKALKAAKAPKATRAAGERGDFDAKLANLLALSKEVTKAQNELDKAISRFESAKASL